MRLGCTHPAFLCQAQNLRDGLHHLRHCNTGSVSDALCTFAFSICTNFSLAFCCFCSKSATGSAYGSSGSKGREGGSNFGPEYTITSSCKDERFCNQLHFTLKHRARHAVLIMQDNLTPSLLDGSIGNVL